MVDQNLNIPAAILDHGRKIRPLGHRHADALDNNINNPVFSALVPHAPVHLDLGSVIGNDIGRYQNVTVAIGPLATDLKFLALVILEPAGIDIDDHGFKQFEILLALACRGKPPVPPKRKPRNGVHVIAVAQ